MRNLYKNINPSILSSIIKPVAVTHHAILISDKFGIYSTNTFWNNLEIDVKSREKNDAFLLNDSLKLWNSIDFILLLRVIIFTKFLLMQQIVFEIFIFPTHTNGSTNKLRRKEDV